MTEQLNFQEKPKNKKFKDLTGNKYGKLTIL